MMIHRTQGRTQRGGGGGGTPQKCSKHFFFTLRFLIFKWDLQFLSKWLTSIKRHHSYTAKTDISVINSPIPRWRLAPWSARPARLILYTGGWRLLAVGETGGGGAFHKKMCRCQNLSLSDEIGFQRQISFHFITHNVAGICHRFCYQRQIWLTFLSLVRTQ